MNGFSKILADIADNTEANRKEGDYIKDGLLFCGKCHTAKQVQIELCGEIKRPYCMCKCEEQEYKTEQERLKEILRREEIERNRAAGILDIDLRGCRFEKDDRANPKISDIALRYVEHFPAMLEKGKGLLLIGSAGTGKSFIAACIANALIDKGYKAIFTNFPRIINELSGMFEGKQKYINSLNNYHLLVIDDLAIERDTEYTAEIIQNVIDSRYRARLPLILTSNLTKADFEAPKDIRKERLFSRLYEMCLPLAVNGEDRRKKNAAFRDNDIKSLLGI